MDDLISRQSAIDVIMADKIEGDALNTIIALGDGKQVETLNMACDRHAQFLNDLPSAQPDIKAAYKQGYIQGRVEMRTELLMSLKEIVGDEVWKNI